ncbi:DUF1822 family protein [Scytonema sp. PCC 10023]|uniref:DUF1822 family protein n=1 Tax=Scytonema sp. PCC 10023 TaxID=1680591 RepID=UPI0039C697BB
MSYTIEPLTFTVTLTLSAHSKAKQFARHQSNPQKAKQVYNNTLAVSAVNFYLQCLGFETDLEKSDSWNPAMQSLMDVADLEVKALGKLELPLSQLRSLEDLPRYLRENQPQTVAIDLRQWFEGVFTAGWQTVDALFSTQATNMALSTRSAEPFRENDPFHPANSVSAGKQFDLGMQLAYHRVVLMVTIAPGANEEVDIRVRVCPTGKQRYLPPGLQLIVLDESGATCPQLEAQAKSDDNWIQLEFSGEPGERFSVKVGLGDESLTEDFVI